MSGWRPALRIARRTVRRNLGRSLLVAVLVAVPVAGATVADVLHRSTSGPEDEVYAEMGDADAAAAVSEYTSLHRSWLPERYWGRVVGAG